MREALTPEDIVALMEAPPGALGHRGRVNPPDGGWGRGWRRNHRTGEFEVVFSAGREPLPQPVHWAWR